MCEVCMFCDFFCEAVSLFVLVLYCINQVFPECVARVPVSLWGSGG